MTRNGERREKAEEREMIEELLLLPLEFYGIFDASSTRTVLY